MLTLQTPEGWREADPKSLGSNVQVMLVGKGKGAYPPSINIGSEPYPLNLTDYVKMVKEVNKSLGTPARELGSIDTKAGKVPLIELEMETEWGKVRLLHAILVKDSHVFVVTAAAPKNEYTSFYPQFLKAFQTIDLVSKPE